MEGDTPECGDNEHPNEKAGEPGNEEVLSLQIPLSPFPLRRKKKAFSRMIWCSTEKCRKQGTL